MRTELAGGVITDPDNRLLLIHRNTLTLTQWELPGGKIENGETPATTVRRELREELGIVVVVGRELGRQNFRQSSRDYGYRWLVAKIIDGRPQPREALHDECRYFSLRQLRTAPDLSPNMENLLKILNDGDIQS